LENALDSVHLDRLAFVAGRSVAIIQQNQTPSGAYLASPNFPVYRYSWFRDGAFIADAMSRAGHTASADAFFGWCSRVITARAAQIEGLIARGRSGAPIAIDEHLHARYSADGTDAGDQWWNFQLDGYGAWLWSLGAHVDRHGGSAQAFDDGVDLCVRYLCEFWREPCYDWWEENKEERHTSTLAAVFAGLVAASRLDGLPASVRDLAVESADAIRAEVLELGVRDGSLVKWLGGDVCDASLLSCGVPFGLVPPDGPLMRSTVQRVVHDLAHPGVHRYAADSYYGGGEWVLLSAWLGWDYALRGRREDAMRQLEWVAAAANPHGELPEQVSHHLLKPERYEEWVGRWGPVATPLLWSHAMYLTLAIELDVSAAPVTPIPA
jgi:GH15 family glucan-1,4-alpha-glucosidase